ncbi:uncharacterized protein Z518_08492 [Rhinocladiella mackenziei CBS 650.93]|uniref:Zn(2)-C6 fungal-type domain-containing protein n=1 Tax=Rhinocladiella mackenziei CBS 650.93 TaxID=1442369 RepID=A0A0D2IGZ0_9EURO|nr:uncharacterized protein Z518_08492 [Rhinocladiella mackenziei CBS 650.93]KIX02551.1 hypothetical protein Z518_08492 [Rhinocladiella mackenziei CBS 650.93]
MIKGLHQVSQQVSRESSIVLDNQKSMNSPVEGPSPTTLASFWNGLRAEEPRHLDWPLVPPKASFGARSQQMRKRRSCDRCYNYKYKCAFKSSAGTCTQCERSRVVCTTLRSRLRPGRKPAPGQVGPNGSVHVWDIGHLSGVDDNSQRAQDTQSPALDSNTELGNRSNEFPRHGSDNNRQIIELSTAAQSPPKLSIALEVCSSASLERLFLLQISNVSCFYAANDIFMIGPTFAPSFHTALRYTRDCSSISLEGAYRAMSTALIWARHLAVSWDRVDISGSVLSLRELRTANICGILEALAVTTLGQTLAAFDVITACSGRSAMILRHSLTLIKPWYPALASTSEFDSITITPIFWDTVHCLLRRELPVVKYIARREAHVVDRMAGLCTGLLPILYDLCVTHNELSQTANRSEEKIVTLQRITERLSSWVPPLPLDHICHFSYLEMAAMRAQARMYRSAALLVIHRIIHPIGSEDGIAKLYADSILLTLSTYIALAGPGRKLQHVVFPVFVAMLETRNASQEIWKSLSLLSITPMCMNKLSAFVEFNWEKRHSGFTGSIFDLIGSDPGFVIVP